jgi:hypothetical protein
MFELGDIVKLKTTADHIKYWKRHISFHDYIPHDMILSVTRVNSGNGCIQVNNIETYIGAWRFEKYIRPKVELDEDLFTI